MLRLAIFAAIFILPAFSSADEAPPKDSPQAKEASQPAAPTAQDKELRLKRLVRLLNSLSDDDYNKAVSQLPQQEANDPLLSSRDKAVKSAYKTMAALEYRQALEAAPAEKKARYDQAYQQVAIASGTVQETGWAVDLFKWLGNAAINYELNGGQVFVGRAVNDPETEKLDQSIDSLSKQAAAADLDPEKNADVHYQLGSAYEKKAAAAIAPPSDEEQAAKKKIRLKQLASLLQSVSDEDYQGAVKQLPAQTGDHAELTSRGAALQSAYTNLAALEYHQAGPAQPQGAQPALQETGWFTDLLGFAGAGGIAYLVYQNQGKHPNSGSAPSAMPQPNAPPSPAPSRVSGKPLDAIPGTVALWHFEDGSGTKLGDSTGLNNGTIVNNPQWAPGIVGNALDFNGTNQYVSAKQGLILGAAPAFTIEAWVRWDGDTPASSDCVYVEGSYNDLINLTLNGGVPVLIILSSNWESVRANAPLSVGQWHHLAATLQSNVGKLYVDGALVGSNNTMGPEIQWGSETDIGAFAGDGRARFFHGKIDEMRIMNVSRGDADIRSDYQQGLGSGAPALLAGRSTDLNTKLDGLENQLSAAELTPEKSAALHQQIGAVYERMAAEAVEPATPPAEKSKPAVVQAAPEPAPAPAAPAAPKPRRVVGPAAQDIILLWDGSRLDGELSAASPEKIVIKTEQGMTGVKQSRIQAVILKGADVDAESDQALAAAAAGTLPMILRAGDATTRGRLASASPRQLVFKTEDGILTYSREDVRAVIFASAPKKP